MEKDKRNRIKNGPAPRKEEKSSANSRELQSEDTDSTKEDPESNTSEQAAQKHFEAGNWQHEAEKIVDDCELMDDLDNKCDEFMQKQGLSRVKRQLVLLWNYLRAVTSGRYKGYSKWAYLKVVACLLYLVDPFDLLPDFIPWIGWLDDIAVVIYVCGLVIEELDKFSLWQVQQHLSAEHTM